MTSWSIFIFKRVKNLNFNASKSHYIKLNMMLTLNEAMNYVYCCTTHPSFVSSEPRLSVCWMAHVNWQLSSALSPLASLSASPRSSPSSCPSQRWCAEDCWRLSYLRHERSFFSEKAKLLKASAFGPAGHWMTAEHWQQKSWNMVSC